MENKKNILLISSTRNKVDMRYLCGIEPPEFSVLLLKNRKAILLVSEMEKSRMSRQVRAGVEVVSPSLLGIKNKIVLSHQIIELLKKQNVEAVKISSDFPVGLDRFLHYKKIKTEIMKCPVCPGREIKCEEEIKAIKKTQQAAAAGMKKAMEQIAESTISSGGRLVLREQTLTSGAVRSVIHHTLLDLECTAQDIIVSCGPRSADPHEQGEGPLIAGQPIVIDIFPRSIKTGYWGDITRTVCRGPAPSELKKQYSAVKAAQAAQLKKVKAGVLIQEIHKTGAELMTSRGFKTEIGKTKTEGFIHGTGHGVGLEIHEAPRVSSVPRRKLRAGHVITIEPGLYYPHFGGVRIEDTILVTKDGYKMLAPCVKKLEV